MRLPRQMLASCFLCVLVALPAIAQSLTVPCGVTITGNGQIPLSLRGCNSGDCNLQLLAYAGPNQAGNVLLDVTIPPGLAIEVNQPLTVASSFAIAAVGPGVQGVFDVTTLPQNCAASSQYFARTGDDLVTANLGRVGIGVPPTSKLTVGGVIETTSGGVRFPDGTVQTTATSLPSGSIIMWSGPIGCIPAGFALCDGQQNTPNLLNRFVVAAGGAYAVGATGGEDFHTLTIAEMPSHSHGGTARVHAGPCAADGVGACKAETSPTAATGGDQPHENRPPFYAIAFIMKL